jgi:hypothetical protein
MNEYVVIIVSMWKKKQIYEKEDTGPYANELQPNTMETRLQMAFAFFHTECIMFNLSRIFNYEGGVHSALASKWNNIRLARPDLRGKPTIGDMDPLWAHKIAAAQIFDLGDPFHLMENIKIIFNKQRMTCTIPGR